MSTKDTFREAKDHCDKCHACRRVLRLESWLSFFKGLTFGAIDLTLTSDGLWALHQEIFNA